MTDTLQKPSYNVDLINDDMAACGWLPTDLAREAEVSAMTVSRFLGRRIQTARTAKKIARALRKPIERYLIRSSRVAA